MVKTHINKHDYVMHSEPICECMKCGNTHLRKERIKKKIEEEGRFLFIRLCPKCSGESYILAGDKYTRRTRKKTG